MTSTWLHFSPPCSLQAAKAKVAQLLGLLATTESAIITAEAQSYFIKSILRRHLDTHDLLDLHTQLSTCRREAVALMQQQAQGQEEQRQKEQKQQQRKQQQVSGADRAEKVAGHAGGKATRGEAAVVAAGGVKDEVGVGKQQQQGFKWPLFQTKESPDENSSHAALAPATSATATATAGSAMSDDRLGPAGGGGPIQSGSHWLAGVLEGWKGAEAMEGELQVRCGSWGGGGL